MNKFSFLGVILIVFLLQGCNAIRPRERKLSVGYFQHQLEVQTQKALAYLLLVPVDSMAIPRSAYQDGSLNGTASRSWTSGFYPGELWMLYKFSGDKRLKEAAARWTQFVEKEKYDTHTHDLGFKVYCSFGQGFDYTRDERYKQVILDASATLIRRYNPTVGCIRSWDFNKDIWDYPVIIDNMMNLEMLFEATRLSGDSTYYQIAYQHALTTLKNHIRPDHSAYHVIDYDPETGEVQNRHTHQGLNHESTWARGQAWNLYGFAMSYRETGDKAFLHQAKATADFFYKHPNLPKSGIPYWDFDVKDGSREPVDVSAAAIATCGLLILCETDSTCIPTVLPWIDHTLYTLAQQDFVSKSPPFLLDHSVGSIPGDFEVDVPIIYADYYYVEALMRRLALGKKKPVEKAATHENHP